VALALKAKNPRVRIVLADPEGSALYGWVKSNDLTVQGSCITEGIGQSRVPENLVGAPVDDAERIGDAEALQQIFWPPRCLARVGTVFPIFKWPPVLSQVLASATRTPA
jgi:cysteine synthase